MKQANKNQTVRTFISYYILATTETKELIFSMNVATKVTKDQIGDPPIISKGMS